MKLLHQLRNIPLTIPVTPVTEVLEVLVNFSSTFMASLNNMQDYSKLQLEMLSWYNRLRLGPYTANTISCTVFDTFSPNLQYGREVNASHFGVEGQSHGGIQYAINSTFSFHNSYGRRHIILDYLASSYIH